MIDWSSLFQQTRKNPAMTPGLSIGSTPMETNVLAARNPGNFTAMDLMNRGDFGGALGKAAGWMAGMPTTAAGNIIPGSTPGAGSPLSALAGGVGAFSRRAPVEQDNIQMPTDTGAADQSRMQMAMQMMQQLRGNRRGVPGMSLTGR